MSSSTEFSTEFANVRLEVSAPGTVFKLLLVTSTESDLHKGPMVGNWRGRGGGPKMTKSLRDRLVQELESLEVIDDE